MLATNRELTDGHRWAIEPKLDGWRGRLLVEGWSYIAPGTVGQPDNAATNSASQPPFWEPARLAANDRAFTTPTEATVATLRDEYGVRWLLANLRYPVQVGALEQVATVRWRHGDYVVLGVWHYRQEMARPPEEVAVEEVLD